jgi:hypothetical protein
LPWTVHCCITRFGDDLYHLAFQVENAESVSAIAKKVTSSRTSTYHIFDALRGGTNAKLTKKAGHYIGKLRRDKGQPVGCYTLYNSSREKEQVATYVYQVQGLMKQITEGQPPRRIQVIIPKDSALSGVETNEQPLRDADKLGRGTHRNNRLMEHLHNGTWKNHRYVAVQTRAPKYHEGQYRLNFSGRVLTPSVKNMQLETEQGECLLQFGKVGENKFHLDYKVRENTCVMHLALDPFYSTFAQTYQQLLSNSFHCRLRSQPSVHLVQLFASLICEIIVIDASTSCCEPLLRLQRRI